MQTPNSLHVDSVEQTFHELKEKWEAETAFVSSATEMIYNVNYQHIIGLGPDVIPLLLRDMGEHHTHWFWALMMISRENPVDKADAGNVEKWFRLACNGENCTK